MAFLRANAGATQANGQIPAYTGLQIQTSVNSVPIAIVYGANKIAPNCIDTAGFYGYYGYPEGTSGNGKSNNNGNTGSKSWQYYTSWEMALCEGPITGYGTIWQGGNATNFYGADIWFATTGTQNQAGWSIFGPLAYHGVAYIGSFNYYLGTNPNLPQYSMEIFGVLFNSAGINGGDADPAQIIQDFLTNSQYGVGFPAGSINGTTLLSSSVSSTVTINISTGLLTWAGPAAVPVNGDPIVLATTGALPTGLTYGNVYYVINVSGSTFQLSAAPGGSAIALSGSQSGTQTATTADSSYQNYCRASYLALSPALTNQESANSILARWLQLTNTAAVWSGGQLKFIPYGDSVMGPTPNQVTPGGSITYGGGVTFVPNLTPIYNLTDDDYVHEEGKDPIEVSRTDPFACFNWQRIQINQRVTGWVGETIPQPWLVWTIANSYVPAPIDVWDQNAIELYGLRMAPDITANEICDPGVAQNSVQLILQRQLYIRNHYKFKLSFEYCLLEPMDLVTVTDTLLGLNNVAVRITEIEEDENGVLAITAEEFPGGTATAVRYPTQPGGGGASINKNVVPARVNTPIIFEPPSSLTAGVPNVFIGASGGVAAAYLLAETSATGQHYTTQGYGAALTYSVSYVTTLTFSVYAQVPAANPRSALRLNLSNGSSTLGADFNLGAAQPYASPDAGVTATIVPAAAGSSWYLLTISTPLAASTTPVLSILLENPFLTISYAGTAGDGLYIWGQQFSWSRSDGSASEPVTFLPAFSTAINVSLATNGVSTPEGVAGIADPNWGGANVYISTDGSTYVQAGQILGPTAQGTFTTVGGLSAYSGSNPDTTHTPTFNLQESGGTLASSNAASAAAGVPLCVVDQELFSYVTATFISQNVYQLSNLYRGLDGTTAAAHAQGAPFAVVNSSMFQYPLPSQFNGVTLYIKLQSFNIFGGSAEDLSECQVFTYTPTGAGSPLGPVSSALAAGQSLDFGKVSAAVSETDQWGIVTDGFILAKIDLGTVH